MKISKQACASAAVLLGALGVPGLCSAEIYGWIDGSGVVTYSNVPPPKGTDVTQVIHEEQVSAKERAEALREAEANAQFDRVRLREWEMSRPQTLTANYPAGGGASGGPPPYYVGAGCDPEYPDCNAYIGDWFLPSWYDRHRGRYGYGRGFGPRGTFPGAVGPSTGSPSRFMHSANRGAGAAHSR